MVKQPTHLSDHSQITAWFSIPKISHSSIKFENLNHKFLNNYPNNSSGQNHRQPYLKKN